jgi:hypothetical protein
MPIKLFETARLRRNGVRTTCDRVFAEMLGELEGSGEAMRFVEILRTSDHARL